MTACEPADFRTRLDVKAQRRIRALIAAAPPLTAAQLSRLNAVYLSSLENGQRAA